MCLHLVSCPELSAPANGMVSVSGRTATYTCDSGYELDLTSGGGSRTCGADGMWTGSAPTCAGIIRF